MKKQPKQEKCPKCGQEFDPREHEVVECPRCGVEGSTACCNPGGRNCICVACEEGGE
jgi:Zn finger protein HypA/HybF involved in hydrogenase expression